MIRIQVVSAATSALDWIEFVGGERVQHVSVPAVIEHFPDLFTIDINLVSEKRVCLCVCTAMLVVGWSTLLGLAVVTPLPKQAPAA